jgi:hypothetical protein
VLFASDTLLLGPTPGTLGVYGVPGVTCLGVPCQSLSLFS